MVESIIGILSFLAGLIAKDFMKFSLFKRKKIMSTNSKSSIKLKIQ